MASAHGLQDVLPGARVEFFQGDRVAGLIPRGIGLGDVLGILGCTRICLPLRTSET